MSFIRPLFRLISHYLVAVALLVHAAIVSAGALEQLFAPSADLWDVWQAHRADSAQRIDHGRWDRFLANNVQRGEDGINRIGYESVSQADRHALQIYLSAMQAVPVSDHNRDEQLAYWINLYNALTVDVVLRHYPVESIRDIDISPGLFADGPWGKTLLTIEGREVSLNDIEHRILRPIWKDARVHYAVNCASLGCPNLQQRAYSANDINMQLDSAARDYVNHPRGVRVEGQELYVSSIYSWFQVDFGQTEAEVIRHLQIHAAPELAKQLEDIKFFTDDHYDWSLNSLTGHAQ